MSQDATTQSFKELIESLKQTSAQQLEQLTQQVVISERICQGTINAASASKTHADAGSEDLVKDVYMDALIGAETRATMKQLVRCIDSGKVDKIRANFYLTRLSLVDEDAVTGKDGSIVMELVDSLLMKRTGSQSSSMSRELLEAIERQKMFATTASLAKSLKKQQDNKSRNTQIERMVEQVTKTIAERYIYTTASAQQQQQEPAEKKADRQAALKAIGNIPSAYYPKETVQLLLKLASTSYESNAVRQSAIEALEDCDEARQLVKSIIKNVQEPTEVRIAAYRCLMTMSVTVGDIDELIALVSDSHRQSQDKQLIMYIVSHLNNVRNTNNRDYEQIVDILHANKQHYMAVQLLAKKFSHMQDMRKYSRNFQLEQSIGKIESGLIVESDLVYGDEEQQQQKRDYLPKLVRLNVSMPVFGKNVNVMEIAVRQDNMEEQIMRSMPKNFALKNGKLSMNSIERIVDAIKSVAKEQQEQQQQQQQQEQEKISNKNFNSNSNEEPEADLSIKVDGCTVLYVSLDDFKSTTSNQQRIRRNARTSAFEDVLEAMKKSFAFNRGAHFAINKRLAGILDIDAVLTGAMRVESRVHSISADQFEIVAHVQPRFGFEAIVGPSTISKRLLQRISTESSLAVHMKYSRSELVEVQVDLPMDDMELFKFQSEIVEQTRSGSYKYTRPSSMTGRDTDVYSDSANKFNTYNTNTNNYNKWSLKGKKQSTSSSSYYAKQLEMPAKLVRALGLDGKIELVYSPRDLTYLARCVVNKVEPSMQGYRFQIQSQKSNNKQQQQYAIVVSTPGSSQVDRNIQMRVLKQTTPQRVTIKTDLISSFAAGSAQLELVRDERQVALRLETISRQGKAAKLEAGFQQTTPVMNGKKQVTLKPYMTIVVPNQPAMRFDGLVSIQQGPKTVIAYDFKMPEQLFTQLYAGKRSQQTTTSATGQAQFVRGKIIADIDEPTTSSYSKQRRSMSSPLERYFSQDVIISSETVAQLGELAVKLHAMLESKAQESFGFEVSTQYQLGAHKRQEQSKFAAKLHYQVPRGQQKGAAQRQSLYLEHECTAHPEHAFLVQVNHAYKPEEHQDLSIDLHYAGNNKNKRGQQDNKEQVSYSHQLKYKQDAVECVFAIKATPVDYEREAKLIVQTDKLRFNSSSAKFQSLRNSRSRSMSSSSSSDDNTKLAISSSSSPSLKVQFVVVDTLNKETTVEARYEMNDYKSVLASLKLDNNKRQYRVAHQVRRDESGNKFNNKLQLDIEGKQSEIDYVVRAEKLSRGVHELIVDGVAKTHGSRGPINFETKTRVQYERDIGFEHRTQTSGDFHLELVCKPQQGIYKLAHQSEEIVMDMMARVMPNPEPVKQIQWQLKQRRSQFVHQTKVLIDEREDKLVVQSQQQSPRNNNKSYKLDALLNFSSKKSTPSYLQAVWDDARAKASIEYQPESGHFQSQISTRSIAHKTIVDVRRKHSSSSLSFSSMLKSLEDCEITVQSRTDKNSKLVCEIQAKLSSARQARQQVSMNIPKWYEIKVEMINGDGRTSYGGMLAKQVRYVAKKGQENKSKNTGYEQYQLMMDASTWPNTKFESDVTDYTGRRSSFAADMWAQEEKPSTFAMQSPMYVSQSELVFGREQGLRLKGSLKNLERNERYELDTGLATGNKHRSYFKLDAPEHKSFAFFEPQTQSGEFSIERPAHKSSPWSLKSKFESERDQQQGSIKSKLGRFVRRATVEYDDEYEQHQHSFQFTPSTENVKFMSERRFKSPQQQQQQQQKPWWKLQTDVSSYRAQEALNKPSMFNLETADYDADFTVKPFGDEQHAAWKIRARRSINEGELSKYHSSKDNKKDNKKESGKTYKAMMKHLSDKQLRALLESECSSSGERCKSKLHVPSKFTSRYEHDFDYEKSTHSTNDNNNKKSSRLSKFDFELDAPERRFSHMSSFEMERPRGSALSWRHKRSTGSTYERSGASSSSLISLRKNLENMDARIKSKTVYDNDELYNIEAQLNQGLYSNNKQDNKPLSSLKFNTQQWRSEMQYQPESHAQFEFVTPEQRRHLTRFEPMTESADMLKFTSKSFNKRGNQEYQMQGQFPGQYLRQLTTDSNNVMIDGAQQKQYSAPTKFDYQDDSYKAGFDFDNERTNWYMNNAKSGFEHNTKLARSIDGKQQQEKVLTTITKSARFGTLAYVDVTVSPVDKSMTINIESALIKGKIVAESVRGTEQKVIKFKFENQQNINEQIARELVREYLSTNNKNYSKFVSSKYVQKIETLVKQLAQVPFKHETELVYDAREQSYKIKTQIERNQQLVLDASATVMPERQTVARCHTRRIQSELIVDHKTGAFQVRATGETIRDNKTFTHETVVEKLSNDLYSIQSRTTYKQRELATIVGRVMTPTKALYTQDKVSQIEATLFEAKYRVMVRQTGDLVKVIVQDDKRQLVHDNEFKYDQQRERVEFQCRTTDNKYNTVVYKSQGVVALDSDEVSHIVIDSAYNKAQLKAQYVPKKELNVAVDGATMKHMTKLELPQSNGARTAWAKAVKQMKLRSYTKSQKLSYDVDAFVDTYQPIYKIKAQAFDAKDRQMFDLVVVGQPQQRSIGKLNTRHFAGELIADHKTDSVELRCETDNKKYTHETQVQRIGGQDYTIRSITNYKNQQLVKLVGRVAPKELISTRSYRSTTQGGSTTAELEAHLFDQQYKVIAQANKIQGGKMHKYTLNVDDNKRNIVSQNDIVYDTQREQIVFQSRVADKYQGGIIYKADGRISTQADDEQSSQIKYVSQRSQMNVEYKPKKEMLIDIETPEVEHSTKLIMPTTQVASRIPWKSAFQQMNLSSSLNAPLRSSPYKKFAYNFDADFDVHRKPSMFAIKLH
ncbi:hypothetical protein GZH46_02567, partial [Fragariocoptes setiger]